MAKQKVRKDIREAKQALKELMLEHLESISDNLIERVMAAYGKLPNARKGDAVKDLSAKGFGEYKNEFKVALAVIAGDALEKARQEVPKKSKVKLAEWDNEEKISLGEFEQLPSKIRKRLTNQINILMTTQKADLEKVVMLQFSSSYESIDSETTIKADIYESVNDWMDGPSIQAGAGVMAARTINESRQAFFFDDEVLDEIDGFEFRNDVPESPICEDLNGTIFSADDPGAMRYQPPLHFNCDSYILPILKGNLKGRDIEKLIPSDKKLENFIQFHDRKCCGRIALTNIEIDTNN